MFTANYDRNRVTITATGTSALTAVETAIRAATGAVLIRGDATELLYQTNKAQAAAIRRVLGEFTTRPATAPMSGTDGYAARVVHFANSPVPAAPTLAGPNGTTLEFAGYGREFIANETFGEFWGEAVRYAYYRRPTL